MSKRTFFYLLLICSLPISANTKLDKTLNNQFKTAYFAYQDAIKSNNTDAQFNYAKEAYQLGIKLYGDSDINTANLALILAKQHLNKKQEEQANSLLHKTLEIFENNYGESAAELAEIYILLGQTQYYKERDKAIRYYVKAIGIAEKHEDSNPYFTAQTQLDAGIGLLGRGSRRSNAILTAQKFFSEHFPKNDKRVIEANFFAGKYYLARNKYNTAIKHWQANLPVFNALEGATHPLELSTRAFLINALEKKGKSEEATKHCIAIGSMTPWDDSQEQRPLFRSNPKYPIDYARRGKSGWVKIGFTISDFGTVKNAKVIKSEGGKGFEKSALAALEKWRYAPKFEDGQPIEAYATVQLDFKMN
ncbi:MAG: TonB family protein [Colwellia sp.]|nr:TonB family protein [Colwellia sp.]MCW9080302.1 TonB family protein [Colwellia sp.]